jgi:pimeloyl-ACP methyl ester carboxylesterase
MISQRDPDYPVSDPELVAMIPGFDNARETANGVGLHYVLGGDGPPLILLPGWPQNWWQFSRIMPQLAKRFRVHVVDLRGMGGSDKPESGYDKRTMAADIYALAVHLGLGPINIGGNDIGSMVAYSFAANYPEMTKALVMMDAPHPFEVLKQIPVLPTAGSYDLDRLERVVHPWWLAFNQIPGLMEKVCDGRYHLIQDWIFDYLAMNKAAITPHDRAVSLPPTPVRMR